ncbi:hydroxymethylbilane synthase [Streptomyces sp. NPDC001796]|uniref:hydroxymethylbilane synthase n=1 Tax=Streptomyces sp. NPDC001796 TaxID=3364609 RepID=UPI0036881BC8
MNQHMLRLGSRRSPMAMAQSRRVAGLITERIGRPVQIVGVATPGDVSPAHAARISGTGVFVGALREALLDGEIDLVVHSLKGLPTGPAAGIALAAVPPRDDPRDALVARDGAKLADLPRGATIGTGSPRRAAQLLSLRGDLRRAPTRQRRHPAGQGELDGVVLAYAGLARIGRVDAVTQVFEPDEMLPAHGQGALAVECRASEPELAALLGTLTCQASLAAVTAERSLLETLQAGCSAQVGAFAASTQPLRKRATVLGADGRRIRGSTTEGNTGAGRPRGRRRHTTGSRSRGPSGPGCPCRRSSRSAAGAGCARTTGGTPAPCAAAPSRGSDATWNLEHRSVARPLLLGPREVGRRNPVVVEEPHNLRGVRLIQPGRGQLAALRWPGAPQNGLLESGRGVVVEAVTDFRPRHLELVHDVPQEVAQATRPEDGFLPTDDGGRDPLEHGPLDLVEVPPRPLMLAPAS